MSGQRIAYKRVSTLDQSLARQLDGMAFDRVFEERASGKDTNRPVLTELLLYARDGDTVVVHSIDRLARNLPDLLHLVRQMLDKGVRLEFVKEALTFDGRENATTTLLLSVLGAAAQFERELLHERQREGIAVARRQNHYKGGKPKLSVEQAADLRRLALSGVPKAQLARRFGIHRDTIYRYLRA